MKKIFFNLIAAIMAAFILNTAGAVDYIVGSGAEYAFQSGGEKSALSIYITESSFTKLGVEYYMHTQGLLQSDLYQQFTLGLGKQMLTLDAGYIFSSEMNRPEIMSQEFLNNNKDGVSIEDFFFSKGADIEKNKVAMEKIEVPAGSVMTTHYRKTHGNQTVDFWISDKAGAIGLVKLVSTGKNADHNYTVELMSLIKNVKPKIDPKQAVPLSDKGRFFLSKKNKS